MTEQTERVVAYITTRDYLLVRAHISVFTSTSQPQKAGKTHFIRRVILVKTVSPNERVLGLAGEGISEYELRLERYRILMSYDDASEINGAKLAEQCDVPTETVASLVAGAKRMSPDGKFA